MFKNRTTLVLKLLLTIFLVGCSTVKSVEPESENSKSLRIEAYEKSQKGDHDLAISLTNRALKKARKLNQITEELIEGHDDLGLYYFLKKNYQRSTYHQSIAVVLSHFDNPGNKNNKVYLERLGWAYAKYDPTFYFIKVKMNPLVLVCQDTLSIRHNNDIKNFFYERGNALSIRRKNKLGRTKLIEGICVD